VKPVPGLTVIYVMARNQVNPKAERFIREHGLQPFVFLSDPHHKVIDQFGVYNSEPHEEIERGTPHPTTYLLDRDGKIILKDTRKDYRFWLASDVLRDALNQGTQAQRGD
jgi:peroxiredoxin